MDSNCLLLITICCCVVLALPSWREQQGTLLLASARHVPAAAAAADVPKATVCMSSAAFPEAESRRRSHHFAFTVHCPPFAAEAELLPLLQQIRRDVKN
ncbi:hypothetical protein U9M48_011588 [Paspalum notatum var. saurae]|uniref:Secreted protein n=1 Tax=Paspalum notatum var. saurae TaxID=547442 RepID=A0AAQ3WHJ3_PASNO